MQEHFSTNLSTWLANILQSHTRSCFISYISMNSGPIAAWIYDATLNGFRALNAIQLYAMNHFGFSGVFVIYCSTSSTCCGIKVESVDEHWVIALDYVHRLLSRVKLLIFIQDIKTTNFISNLVIIPDIIVSDQALSFTALGFGPNFPLCICIVL